MITGVLNRGILNYGGSLREVSVYSSPVVANGIVYVGSEDKNLYAIDAVTGKEKWRFATGDHIYSSPSVANGSRLYRE